MCLLVALINVFPKYPLILIHNREENPVREFSDLKCENGIIASRDIQTNGIWMGLQTKTKNILTMTNNRIKVNNKNEEKENVKFESRGILNYDLLDGKYNLKKNSKQPINLKSYYNGFNILLFETQPIINCYYLTNRSDELDIKQNQSTIHSLNDGIHIISNGKMDDDVIWTRSRILRNKLKIWISQQMKQQNNNKKSKLSIQKIVNELSLIMSDSNEFEEKEFPTLKQCEFSYFNDPKREQKCHKCMFFDMNNPNYTNDYGTICQGIIIVENKDVFPKNKETANRFYHYFHRTNVIKMETNDKKKVKYKTQLQKWQHITC